MTRPADPTGRPHAASVAVVYGSMFGATERIAEDIAAALEARLGTAVPCLDASWTGMDALRNHDLVIIGACTWNIGQLPYAWEEKLEELAALDLRGVTVALFGTGDQVGYPETFLDALGTLAAAVRGARARLVGSWPVTGYRFSGSLALEDGRFVGLALDDDNEPELTHERVARWLDVVLAEAGVPVSDEQRAPLAATSR